MSDSCLRHQRSTREFRLLLLTEWTSRLIETAVFDRMVGPGILEPLSLALLVATQDCNLNQVPQHQRTHRSRRTHRLLPIRQCRRSQPRQHIHRPRPIPTPRVLPIPLHQPRPRLKRQLPHLLPHRLMHSSQQHRQRVEASTLTSLPGSTPIRGSLQPTRGSTRQVMSKQRTSQKRLS